MHGEHWDTVVMEVTAPRAPQDGVGSSSFSMVRQAEMAYLDCSKIGDLNAPEN